MYVFVGLCVLGLGFYAIFITAMFRDDWRRRRSNKAPVRTVNLGTVFAMDTAQPGRPEPITRRGQRQVVVDLSGVAAHSGRRSYAQVATRGRALSLTRRAADGEEPTFS
jgi:hypothetical protein